MSHPRNSKPLLAILLLIAFVAVPVLAQDAAPIRARIDAELLAQLSDDVEGSTEPIPVIVQMREGRGMELDGLLPQASVSARQLGAYAARLDASAIQEIAGHPDVLSIAPDRIVRANLETARAAMHGDLAFSRYGLSGQGVTVALIDSGLASGAALPEERVLARVDLIDENGDAQDAFGHGTHIAGLIAGARGVAPEADLVVLRVLNEDGAGHLSGVLSAINWVINHKDEYGIKVINMSMGYAPRMSLRFDPINIAVRRAWAAGLTVVCSAGNRGRDGHMTINAPGNDPVVLTVGAMNDFNTIERADDGITTYSSRGPSYGDRVVKPDVVAPGNRIVGPAAPGSTLVLERPSLVSDEGIELSGTSMSTGLVSGVAALLHELHPAITNDGVKSALMRSAEKLPEIPVSARGAGYVDVLAAIELSEHFAQLPHFNSTSPLVGSHPMGDFLYRITPMSSSIKPLSEVDAVYGDTLDGLIWGDAHEGRVWGDGLIWADGYEGLLWGDTLNGLIWGDTYDGLIWGDSNLGLIWADANMGLIWADGQLGLIWGDALEGLIWGDTLNGLLWGDSLDGLLWGDTLNGLIWGDALDGLIWGDGLLWADAMNGLIWGDTYEGLIWGDALSGLLWGDSLDGLIWGDALNGLIWGDNYDGLIWGDEAPGNVAD